MRLCLIALMLFFVFPQAFAKAGSEGVGGGDPMAAEFVSLAKKFVDHFSAWPAITPSAHEIRAMKVITKAWWRSIN